MAGRRILVVDDEESMRTLLEVALGVEDGIDDVRVTEHGDQALEVCRHFRPDVLITDSLLPGMSGEEIASGVRAAHPDVTVISFTGLDGDFPWADARVGKGSLDALQQLRALILNGR